MDDVKVEVRGIRELKSALRQVDSNLTKELKEGFKRIAEMVAGEARPRVPHKTGKAAGSITARGSQKGAALAFGGTKAPYYPWLDFGGSTGPGHIPGKSGSGSIKRDWRGAPVGEGRYVYPAIRSKNRDIIDMTDDVLEQLIKRAGFETTGDN